MSVVARAGPLREWSQGGLRLYSDWFPSNVRYNVVVALIIIIIIIIIIVIIIIVIIFII